MANTKAMTIGERVRAALKAANMPQGTLSKIAGVSQSTISRIVTDDSDDPGVNVMLRIARALGVPLESLLNEPELPDLDEAHAAVRDQVIEVWRHSRAPLEEVLRYELNEPALRILMQPPQASDVESRLTAVETRLDRVIEMLLGSFEARQKTLAASESSAAAPRKTTKAK